MLKDEDRIFKNLYSDTGADIDSSIKNQTDRLDISDLKSIPKKFLESFDEKEFENLIILKDQEFNEKINLKFLEARNERIKLLDEDRAKIEAREDAEKALTRAEKQTKQIARDT